jgi:hypothetical protein
VIAVVIPAHDEGRVIERCLARLLDGAEPGELEVVVVCNGCADDTAERARRFGPPVTVVETPIASKVAALNLGDEVVAGFPRFYVDADVELDIAAVRDVAAMLAPGSGVAVAAPRAVVAHRDRRWGVRSFYEVWTRMPYFTDDMVGSGVYAFSEEGRAGFGAFPDVIADDEVARRAVPASARRSSPRSTFTIHPPRTLRGVVAIMTRARAGNVELAGALGSGDAGTGAARTLGRIAATPATWVHAPVYLAVMALAERRARRRAGEGNARWERDLTSRAGGATA